jgi:hypothetical protein
MELALCSRWYACRALVFRHFDVESPAPNLKPLAWLPTSASGIEKSGLVRFSLRSFSFVATNGIELGKLIVANRRCNESEKLNNGPCRSVML